MPSYVYYKIHCSSRNQKVDRKMATVVLQITYIPSNVVFVDAEACVQSNALLKCSASE